MNESLNYEEIHVKCISPNVARRGKQKMKDINIFRMHGRFIYLGLKMWLMKVVKFIK
jgi:hypothetical protein